MGSNQRHSLLGPPENIIEHAVAALEMPDIDVFAISPIIASRPIGPSSRVYANAAAILSTHLNPDAVLQQLQAIERHFGRNCSGQRWRSRTLDLDIILWSGGAWISNNPKLSIPHNQMHFRNFVLQPAAAIAPNWRDPVTGLAIKHLVNRLNRPKPLDPRRTPD